ncbi:iron-siderophore ABC transporter substrate-binding protein [Chlorogloeopsis fritschii PCC 9212]|uniref:Iron siderophore-binding protein n=1 Tax=Chlorogloeopsis fritschii PCC 6912 TaxID=211165 RepID=A0A433NNF3_CHLFR|nr:iron-siderophore ABC transporter substrate-binding protein [Chlorogloeopsis fritschii]RUR84728.1 iron siderophore-binding protein [Chlorogloeopsis fritschii PCC 6912]
MTLTVIFLKGCYSFSEQKVYSPTAKLITSECRIIKHELGESCIPLHPQRIVVTGQDILEVVVALGLKPVGTVRANIVGSKARVLAGKVDDITYLGRESQPNIEKMVQLHPDLILGFGIEPQNYNLFSQIAPTVSIEFGQHNIWKYYLRRIAEILDKSEEAEKLLAHYQQRVQQIQMAMGKRLSQLDISVTRFYAGHSFTQFQTQLSFSGSVLEDLKLSIPATQLQVSQGKSSDHTYIQVSLERLDLLDGDILFVALDPGAERNFSKYKNSSLWQTLHAVKNERVYLVDSGYWIFGNILSANAILDDLFKVIHDEINTKNVTTTKL